MKKYENESIKSLKPKDAIRLRPGVMLGSADINGCVHAMFEILSNSIDEARSGYGKEINFTVHPDNSITVEDHGRGIPLDWNKNENKYNYILLYTELYSGSKFSTDNYDYSLGLNGIGAMACQCSSAWFDVESRRDGKIYNMHFEKGEPIGELKIRKGKKSDTGTIQTWLPDLEVFTDIVIPQETIIEILKQQAIVNAGLKFTFTDERDGFTAEYIYPDGIVGYINELNGLDAITEPFQFSAEGTGKDREDKPEYNVKTDIVFAFNNKTQALMYFHNSSPLEYGGSPDKAVKLAFTNAFDREIKNRGKYNRNESKITFGDIQDSLVLISNSFSTQTSYENQTKKAINNKFIQEFMSDLIKKELAIWFVEHKKDGDKAIEQVLINKRSRETSEQQRITVKKKLMEKTDITNKVKKFVDCRSKDQSERELYICEGDSALGSVKQGRDANYQAIMPIRGKILNCYKADLNSIFKSDIITDLIRVLGCGVEVKGKHMAKDMLSFDINNLKYDKVVALTDSDVDGFHIRVLLITMIYRLCPQLIKEGKVYIGETPLYEITYNDGKTEKTMFAFTDAERDKLIKGKDPKKLTIQRSKGLGENSAEMMHRFMDPKTRRLIRVTPEDAETMSEWFELFMGNKVEPRKEYIVNNIDQYEADLDLS